MAGVSWGIRKDHGSQHAERYYTNFTRLVNAALGLHPDGPRPTRDFLPPIMAMRLAVIEGLVTETIQSGIATAMPYRAAFQTVKDRVFELTSVLTGPRLLAA